MTMDRHTLQSLLDAVHLLEGRLIEYLVGDDRQRPAGCCDSLGEAAHTVAAMLEQSGLAADLSHTLSGMYDSGNYSGDSCHSADDANNSDDEVAPVISPAWRTASSPVDEEPHSLTAASDDEEYYADDDDNAENLEVFDDEETDSGSSSTEGKHPDLSYITINERARFRDNLFGGSKEEFDAAMTLLQQLTSYREAVNYFCNDLEWTPETDDVQAEFLDKIHECFRLAR